MVVVDVEVVSSLDESLVELLGMLVVEVLDLGASFGYFLLQSGTLCAQIQMRDVSS